MLINYFGLKNLRLMIKLRIIWGITEELFNFSRDLISKSPKSIEFLDSWKDFSIASSNFTEVHNDIMFFQFLFWKIHWNRKVVNNNI